MQDDIRLSQTVCSKEVMQVADHCITSLGGRHPFVDEVVDLLWHGLAADSEDPALPRRQEEDRAGLEGVTRVVDLLREVEGVVHADVPRAGQVQTQPQANRNQLGSLDLCPVVRPFCCHVLEVSFLATEHVRLDFVTCICRPKNQAVVLLAFPAQVGCWLATNDVWAELPPIPSERGQFSHSVICKVMTP